MRTKVGLSFCLFNSRNVSIKVGYNTLIYAISRSNKLFNSVIPNNFVSRNTYCYMRKYRIIKRQAGSNTHVPGLFIIIKVTHQSK